MKNPRLSLVLSYAILKALIRLIRSMINPCHMLPRCRLYWAPLLLNLSNLMRKSMLAIIQ